MQGSNIRSMSFCALGIFLGAVLTHSDAVVAQVQGSVPAYIKLQSATPGTAQTGHANVTGTVIASQFQGGGAGLTGLNASNLTIGTVPDSRLSIGGDLNGPLSSASLSRIQGRPLSAAAPTEGDVLKFVSNQWVSVPDTTQLPITGNVSFTGVSIVSSGGRAIEGWTTSNTAGSSGLMGVAGGSFSNSKVAGVQGHGNQAASYGVFGKIGSLSAFAAGRFEAPGGVYVELASQDKSVSTNGFVWRDYLTTSCAAIPVAYGSVNGSGTIAGGTGNFSVTKTATGTYEVLISGEVYANSTFSVSVTPVSSVPKTFGVVNPASDAILLRFWDAAGNLSDTQFQFTAYTPTPAEQG